MTGIAMGFVLIAALVLWFVIGSKGHWGIKAATMVLSLYFCLSVGFSIAEFMGWPTDDKLPPKFLLHWAVIQEPDVKLGDEGSIYVWVRPINEPKIEHKEWSDYLLSFYDGKSEPRAYRIPYSRELHEQAQKAIEAISKGEGVGGTSEEGSGKGKKKSSGKGSGKTGDGGKSLTNNGGIEFHKLPPPKLPDKDGY